MNEGAVLGNSPQTAMQPSITTSTAESGRLTMSDSEPISGSDMIHHGLHAGAAQNTRGHNLIRPVFPLTIPRNSNGV